VLLVNHHLSKSRKVVMKKHLFYRIVVVGAVVVLMGGGVTASFADDSPFGPFGGKQPINMASQKLTEDQLKKMETERNTFQTATKDIRQQINEKRQALNTELAKKTPDAATATALQKSISDLQAQFDQKRLAHILAMKKIDPDYTEGPGMGRGMGSAMLPGMGPGMGHGGPKPSN
jgi:Spy/CpxP family protein refolding chaperone